MNEPPPLRTWQFKEGYCAICPTYGPLTSDHVWPDRLLIKRRLTLNTLIGSKESKRVRRSQDGVKFRTLCPQCNNVRLGAEYDPELIRVCKSIRAAISDTLRHRLVLPKHVEFKIKPHRLARAVVGHSLASMMIEDVNQPRKESPMYQPLREFFLNPRAPLPADFHIYYWYYHGPLTVALNAFAYVNWTWPPGTTVLGNFLKSNPLAFWIVFKKPAHVQFKLYELDCRAPESLDVESVLTLDPAHTMPATWPETIDDNGSVFLADHASLVAQPIK